jgi:hypothetical protein
MDLLCRARQIWRDKDFRKNWLSLFFTNWTIWWSVNWKVNPEVAVAGEFC